MENGSKTYHVYILQNPSGCFYIGHTDDLERRISEHNNPESGSGKYTHKNGPWKLVYSEDFETRSDAIAREKFIKSRKSSKWIRKHLLFGRTSPDVYRD